MKFGKRSSPILVSGEACVSQMEVGNCTNRTDVPLDQIVGQVLEDHYR